MKVTRVSPFRLSASGGCGCNRVPSTAATASLYLFSTSLNRCHSRKFHLDGQSGRQKGWMGEKKTKKKGGEDNKTLWFLRGALNKWIHLEAAVRLVCIPTAADETAAAGGIWRACAAIVFDACHRGNSFSRGLPLRSPRICVLWPNNAVKMNLLMWWRRLCCVPASSHWHCHSPYLPVGHGLTWPLRGQKVSEQIMAHLHCWHLDLCDHQLLSLFFFFSQCLWLYFVSFANITAETFIHLLWSYSHTLFSPPPSPFHSLTCILFCCPSPSCIDLKPSHCKVHCIV